MKMEDLGKWDRRFLNLAAHVAAWSKDPSTKVGAVLVDADRRVISTGYNGFPRGVRDKSELYANKSMKYARVVHSEVNAVLNAIVSPRGSTLYTTKACCNECAKVVIQAGVSRVVMPGYDDSARWSQAAAVSLEMFQQAGLRVLLVEDQ